MTGIVAKHWNKLSWEMKLFKSRLDIRRRYFHFQTFVRVLVQTVGKNMLWTEEVASQKWALRVPRAHSNKAGGCL